MSKNKARPARLDADKTAKPLTKLVAKKPPPGVCYSPAYLPPVALVEVPREETHAEYIERRDGKPEWQED